MGRNMINYSIFMWKNPLIDDAEEKAYAKNQVTKVMRFDLSCYADDKEFAKKLMRIDIHDKKIRVRYLPNSQLLLEAEIVD